MPITEVCCGKSPFNRFDIDAGFNMTVISNINVIIKINEIISHYSTKGSKRRNYQKNDDQIFVFFIHERETEEKLLS